jgi:hypothetical protein
MTAGLGPAARLSINNTASTAPVVQAMTPGLGRVAELSIANATNSSPVLAVHTSGTGYGGSFIIGNSSSGAAAVSGSTIGSGPAGQFVTANPTSQAGAVTAGSDALAGSAGRFINAGRGYAVQAIGTHDAQAPTVYASRIRMTPPISYPDNNVLRNATIDGFNQWPAGVGVSGRAQDGIGVAGYTETGEAAVKGWSAGRGLAGLFVGSVEMRSGHVTADSLTVGVLTCTGSLSKPAGTFRIDHPLDPANKYLYHSFVESPDMLNVYDGVVTLDARGEASVALPDWFQALNRDFRYQLTPIGAAAPNLHISSEVEGNRFAIAGGVPGMRVSWLITGVRHDPYAEDHRVQVEVEKSPAERGTYVYKRDTPASEESNTLIVK